MNAQHSPASIKKWLGDSVGHWDGDTLVVETTNFNELNGGALSAELKVTERFQRYDANTILYRATMEDPAMYTKPWTTKFYVKFRPGWDLMEYVCLENNKDLAHIGTSAPR